MKCKCGNTAKVGSRCIKCYESDPPLTTEQKLTALTKERDNLKAINKYLVKSLRLLNTLAGTFPLAVVEIPEGTTSLIIASDPLDVCTVLTEHVGGGTLIVLPSTKTKVT